MIVCFFFRDEYVFFCIFVCFFQPRGRTFPMLEGPSNQESSVENEQECVITPSTTVKFSAALKERNRMNVMRNSLLLIGSTTAHSSRPALRAVPIRPSSGDFALLLNKL